MKQPRLVKVSKEMSYILRHKPPPEMDKSGFVPLETLMRCMKCRPSIKEILLVVEGNDKKRFVVEGMVNNEAGGQGVMASARIRAAQGHSVILEEPILEALTQESVSKETNLLAVHGTSKKNFQRIAESGELRRMNRQHVHFSTKSVHLRRDSLAAVLLQVDLPAALASGLQFFRSTNDVVLTPGPVPLQYLKQIDRSQLPDGW